MTGQNSYPSDVAAPMPDEQAFRQILDESYDPAKTLNVVQMAARTQDMFTADAIDPKLRQMIILRAATVLSAPYEWQANVPMYLNNGVTQAHVDAAGSAGPVRDVEPKYVLACKPTDEMYSASTLAGETHQSLLDQFDATATRKIMTAS